MNKKKLITGIALTGATLTLPFMAFANLNETSTENKIKQSPFQDLSDEEFVDFMTKKIELKSNMTQTLIDKLEGEGVDITEFETIIDDFAELTVFLESVDTTEMTREDIREEFFELRPEKELVKEFKQALKDTFEREELTEIKEEFKNKKEELREEYGLPEKSHDKKKGKRGGDRQGPQSIEE